MTSNLNKSDTSLWLHNKLGNTNDLWSGGSICSQLNADVLKNIVECFVDLQSLVKLKLLLSFLHIPRRSVEQWKQELDDILKVASADSDHWVCMVAELLKTFPETGAVNYDIEVNSEVFTNLIHELKKSVRKHGDQGILPIESLYLNKSAFNAQIGAYTQPVKHFTLRRRPKSAALRAELVQKSNDVASNARKTLTPSSALARYRGSVKELNDNTPMKGIPSRSVFSSSSLGSSFKTPTPPNRSVGSVRNPTRPTIPGVRRDGGIKLLDIGEQPLGRDAKRKKKDHKEEADKKLKEGDKVNEKDQSATPDYALGLTSLVPPSPAPSYSVPPTPEPPTNDYAPSKKETTGVKNISSNSLIKPTARTISADSNHETEGDGGNTPLSPISKSEAQPVAVASPVKQSQAISPQVAQVALVQKQVVSNQNNTTCQPPPLIPTPAPQPQTTTRLQLTQKQIHEAQEMFKNSNLIGKVEKALILSFMGGSRENPCPHLGDIVTIKLGESEEQARHSDGTIINVIVENHYQMDYSTGEAKKIKKLRKI